MPSMLTQECANGKSDMVFRDLKSFTQKLNRGSAIPLVSARGVLCFRSSLVVQLRSCIHEHLTLTSTSRH